MLRGGANATTMRPSSPVGPDLMRARVWLHRRRLRVFCRLMSGHPDHADDLVDDIIRAVVRQRRATPGDPVARLYALARDQCRVRVRGVPPSLTPMGVDLASVGEPARAALLMREVGA